MYGKQSMFGPSTVSRLTKDYNKHELFADTTAKKTIANTTLQLLQS